MFFNAFSSLSSVYHNVLVEGQSNAPGHLIHSGIWFGLDAITCPCCPSWPFSCHYSFNTLQKIWCTLRSNCPTFKHSSSSEKCQLDGADSKWGVKKLAFQTSYSFESWTPTLGSLNPGPQGKQQCSIVVKRIIFSPLIPRRKQFRNCLSENQG